MIPVEESQLKDININEKSEKYKQILISQYRFCNKHIDEIKEKALKTYEKSNQNEFMKKMCCNFKLLEKACKEYEK